MDRICGIENISFHCQMNQLLMRVCGFLTTDDTVAIPVVACPVGTVLTSNKLILESSDTFTQKKSAFC